MVTVTAHDRLILLAVLFKTPFLPERRLAGLWPDTDAGRENMARRLGQLRSEGLLARHMADAQAAGISLFYHWSPEMPEPDFGALAWALARRWEAVEPEAVGLLLRDRPSRKALRPCDPLSAEVRLGGMPRPRPRAVYVHFAIHHPPLAGAWVAEDLIATARGYGEKVVDACVVDSTATPALAIEFAGRLTRRRTASACERYTRTARRGGFRTRCGPFPKELTNDRERRIRRSARARATAR